MIDQSMGGGTTLMKRGRTDAAGSTRYFISSTRRRKENSRMRIRGDEACGAAPIPHCGRRPANIRGDPACPDSFTTTSMRAVLVAWKTLRPPPVESRDLRFLHISQCCRNIRSIQTTAVKLCIPPDPPGKRSKQQLESKPPKEEVRGEEGTWAGASGGVFRTVHPSIRTN